MSKISIGERLAAGVVGAIFGAVIGGAAAWMFGVYSHTMGPGTVAVGFKAWVLLPAAGFGLSGLILGSDVGTVIGAVINAMFEFEKGPENPWPILQLLLAIGLIAIGAWWVMH